MTKDDDVTYLGDGVYARFDGFQIWVAANHPESEKKVALEPDVLRGLVAYARGKGFQL